MPAIEEVPAYTELRLKPPNSEYCICVFVINEGTRIRRQLEVMAAYTDIVDVIVADGGSTDGSLDQGFMRQHGVSALLTKTGPGRLSAQMRMALSYSLRQGYDGSIVTDGNGKDDMAAIPRFVEALRAGFDHVQGSRFIPGGRAVNTPLSRYLALRLVHAPLVSLSAGFRYTDTTNGFRAYSRRLLTHPAVQPFRDIFSEYELHYYLAIRAAQLGMRIKEVPVTRTYPSKGKIPTKISPLTGNLLILKTLLKAALHQYDPG